MTYAANGSALAAGGECASKHPSAGGNIGGRQRAELIAQDFDLYSWRYACWGSGTWRWVSTPRDSTGTGRRCALTHTDGKERCYACNEIKLPVKEFGPDRTPRMGTLAPQHVRRRSQSNEEDRYMPKSDMTGTEGEIIAVYQGGVRHAES